MPNFEKEEARIESLWERAQKQKKKQKKAPLNKTLQAILTESANAERFVHQHGEDVRYVHEFGRWYIFDGYRWRRDESGRVMHRARETAQRIFAEAATAGIAAEANAIASHAQRSLSFKGLRAMLEIAKTDLTMSQREFDANLMLLGVENGVVDLTSGLFTQGRRKDYLTKAAQVAFNAEATCPRWIKFVSEIMGGKQALIDYLQRYCGYTLTGKTTEQCFGILYGCGANGKSTFLDVLKELFGTDYATSTAPDQLLARRNDRHPTELADLRGARLVVSVETGQGRRLNENLVKQVTGGDPVKARFMRQNFFEFKPEFKLLLATNHKPAVTGVDHAIWRRIHLVPFTEVFDGNRRDDELKEKLLEELSGIFNWCLEGCLAWQKIGLHPPEEVIAATAEYRAQMDVLADFLEDCCVTANPRAKTAKTELYKAYQIWCSTNGETGLSQRDLSQRMQERGFTEVRNSTARFWRGIGLKDTVHNDKSDDFTRARAAENDASDVDDAENSIDAFMGMHKASMQKTTSQVSLASQDDMEDGEL